MSRIVQLALALAAAWLAAACLRQSAALKDVRARLASLEAPAAALETARPVPVRAERPAAAAPDVLTPARIEATNTPARRAPKKVRIRRRSKDEMARLMDDPKRKQYMQAAWTFHLDRTYGDLLRYYEMTPDELAYFRSLLVEQLSRQDSLNARRLDARGSRAELAAVRAEDERSKREVDGRIREFLGEEAWAEYEGYEESMPERMILSACLVALENAGRGLTWEQEDAAIRILYEERVRRPELEKVDDEVHAGLSREESEGVLRSVEAWLTDSRLRLKPILDADQFAAVERQLQFVRDAIEVGLSMAPLMTGEDEE